MTELFQLQRDCTRGVLKGLLARGVTFDVKKLKERGFEWRGLETWSGVLARLVDACIGPDETIVQSDSNGFDGRVATDSMATGVGVIIVGSALCEREGFKEVSSSPLFIMCPLALGLDSLVLGSAGCHSGHSKLVINSMYHGNAFIAPTRFRYMAGRKIFSRPLCGMK